MHRILLAVALAVLAFAATSAPARASQTFNFQIVGAGHVAGTGELSPPDAPPADCTRHVGDQTAGGNCTMTSRDVEVCQDPDHCNVVGGSVTLAATGLDGFTFSHWNLAPIVCSTATCTFDTVGGSPAPFTVVATFADTTAPDTGLTSPADGTAVRGTVALRATATDNVGVTQVVFKFRGNQLPQTFQVPPFALDFDTTPVGEGPATFSVTASDAAGNTKTVSANVTIDRTAPTLTVTGPDGQTFGPGAVPAWTIDARDQLTAVTVSCSVVPAGQPPAFGPCTSAIQERVANQPDGRYTLTVQAKDAAGNTVQQSKAFAIDTGPPETAITSGPADGASTTATALTWGFAASEPSTFECRLYLTAISPGPFGSCTTGASHSVAGLAPGGYTFEVRAHDAFGNVDPTPAHRTVTVTIPPPPPPPAPPPPPPPVIQSSLTFAFSKATRSATTFTSLVVHSVPAGATVTAVCPKGCARKRLVVSRAHGNVSLKRLVGAKPVRVHTKITVTVAKPGAVSAVKVMEIRSRRTPALKSLCQPPGAPKPVRCG